MNTHVENNTLRSLIATISAPFRATTKTFLTLVLLTAIFCAGSAQAANPIKADTTTMNVAASWSDGLPPSSSKIGEFNNLSHQSM